MSTGIATAPKATLTKGAAPKARKSDSLEKARGDFAKLLRARIAERERELESLRAELSSIGGAPPTARKPHVCSGCGKPGHTRRTCSERAGTPHAQPAPA